LPFGAVPALISMRHPALEAETIAKFKATGPSWQARISDILDAATL